MRYLTIISILILFNTTATESLFAQACCSGGVPISNNIASRPVDKKNLSIRLNYDANILNSYFTGAKRQQEGTIKRFSQSGFLQSVYGISKNLSVNAVFSYVNHKISLINSSNQSSAEGIGDAVFLLQYKLISKPKNSLFISVGPKIPLGNNELKDDSGITLAADLQPGTGSWDIIANVGYTRQGFLKQGISFTATFISKINSYSERFNGAQRYKYGNDFQILTGFSDSYLIKKVRIEPGLYLRFWHRPKDLANESPFPNTGGSWIYFTPSLNINTIIPDISLIISSEIPIYQKLEGTQLSTTIRISAGLQFNIRFKSN